MKLYGLICAVLVSGSAWSVAGLNEAGFDNYEAGELLGQQEWRPQGRGEGKSYSNMRDRASIKIDPETGNRWLVWNAGFDAGDQTRLVKRFPATTGTRAVARLDILPGHETVPGQFIFDFERTGGTSIRFIKGTLRVAEYGSPRPKDSGVAFFSPEWNRVELHFDFDAHILQAYLNGRNAGSYALPENMLGINELNFFAGGSNFETGLDNLSIEVVEAFPEPSQKP
jgi:hypothetical protein